VAFLWLLLIPSIVLVSCNTYQAKAYDYPILPEDADSHYQQIKILGSIGLRSNTVNKLPITEISGIAWDADEQLLYAVSDEGYLYKLKIKLKNNKLHTAKIISAQRLKDKTGRPLRGKYSDAEGLTTIRSNNSHKGDTQLIISFENKPRIAKFSTQGIMLAKVNIPRSIRKKTGYRHTNKALESVAYHPQYGIITAAEYPVKNRPMTKQTLYSTRGKKWHFPASKSANSAITGLEALPNNDILVLERAYKNLFTPLVINLRRLRMDQCNKKQQCKTESIARFDASDGWLLDNFESLTHFRDNQYLMVSDNNNNPFQKTIMVLFEIVEDNSEN
jgi:hypothetical protein